MREERVFFRIPPSAIALELCIAFIFIITPIIRVIGHFTYFKPLIISLISVHKSKTILAKKEWEYFLLILLVKRCKPSF